MSRTVAAALAVLWLGAALPAGADDVGEARSRFRRGAELFKEKRWREAMTEFEAAYRAKPHGAIHFNVAQCRERLEDWPGALRSYQDYLREVPDATDRAAVRKSMQAIEARLARAGVQVLLVYTDPPGARVTLEGLERGKAPLHLVLQPGAYALALDLDGHAPWTDKVTVAANASGVVDVVLKRLPRVAAPSAAPGAAPPDLAVRPPSSPGVVASAAAADAQAPVQTAAPSSFRRHWPAWAAAGTAVVAAAAGVWYGASASADSRKIDALPQADPVAASRYASDARSKARTANVLYAIAGGAAVAGGTLYLLEARF